MAEFEVDDAELKKFLQNLGKAVKDPTAVNEIVSAFSAIVYRDIAEHFSKESGPTGTWKEWSKMYARHMKRTGYAGNKILQFTGRLRQNFRPESRRVTEGSINWFNDAKTKSGYPYAWGHDNGDGKLPQREFMWLSDRAFEKMTDVVWDYLIEEADNG